MNKKTLLEFIQRILGTGTSMKAKYALGELMKILEQQSESQELIELVKNAIDSIPEIKRDFPNVALTEENLKIAHERAKVRMEREAAARAYGRC